MKGVFALNVLLLGTVLSGQSADGNAVCERLATVVVPTASITLAQTVHAGTFTPPGEAGDQAAFRALPAFCRVAATLRPSSDSDIKIEVWMPVTGWNGRFQAVGNGAFSGTINYAAMRTALARGYATSSTDTGHTGGGASWALGHPEKVVDFGWRAIHEMTTASKRIIASHYDRGPAFSYWNGCSAGGRQGMKAAQRFPEDFDGIIAGAPGLDWTGRAAQAVRVAKALEPHDAARLSLTHRQLLHTAVVGACDALDGVKDGLIENPQRCTFDPGILECKDSTGTACLTKAQVDTARLMYSSPVNPKTGRMIAGLVAGSELGWTDFGWTASARATGLDQFRFIVFGDPSWMLQKFDFDADIVRAEETDRDTIDALDPNLKRFLDRGGKLIQYHGWSDPQISPSNSTQYYSRVLEALGGASRIHDSYRLFMAPGMGHCGGGEGPNTFDMVRALEQWVEHGQAPDRIVASHSTKGIAGRTRPLCPYPQVAAYAGTGSTDEAANFVCTAPGDQGGRGSATAEIPILPYKLVEWPTRPTSAAGVPGSWSFIQVASVAITARGALLVLHRGAHPILQFETDGTFVRSWGDGMFSEGKVAAIPQAHWTEDKSHYSAVYGPAGCTSCGAHSVRVDPQGNIWVVDAPGHVVYKLNPDGKEIMRLGTKGVSGTGQNTFNLPTDVAFAANGDVYVSDGYGSARVVKYSRDGKYLLQWGKRGTGPGEFGLPHNLVSDAKGRVYVTDRDNQRIQIFDANGTFLSQWTGTGEVSGLGITTDQQIWTGGTLRDLEGKVLGRLPGTTGGHGVAVTESGDVYIAQLSGVVQKFIKQ